MGVPRTRTAIVGLVAGSVMLAVGYWLATQPDAAGAQEGMVRWFNDPPEPVGWLLALTNPLFRPLPLAVVAVVLLGWLLRTARVVGAVSEVLRAAAIAFVVSEMVARIVKELADQPRPLAVYTDLDTHGYPRAPAGDAFPSAHTAVVVGLVGALWPWMRTSQRVAGVAVAVLTAGNRLYVAAHWPADVLGGAAIGIMAACVAWLVAARWPWQRVRLESTDSAS